jgi:hypothetical protein
MPPSLVWVKVRAKDIRHCFMSCTPPECPEPEYSSIHECVFWPRSQFANRHSLNERDLRIFAETTPLAQLILLSRHELTVSRRPALRTAEQARVSQIAIPKFSRRCDDCESSVALSVRQSTRRSFKTLTRAARTVETNAKELVDPPTPVKSPWAARSASSSVPSICWGSIVMSFMGSSALRAEAVKTSSRCVRWRFTSLNLLHFRTNSESVGVGVNCLSSRQST